MLPIHSAHSSATPLQVVGPMHHSLLVLSSLAAAPVLSAAEADQHHPANPGS